MELRARNVNYAFKDAWWLLRANGAQEPSRNGPVMVAPEPVITVYTHPTERVLFNPTRDANGVFHLMESIWMLAGQNTVGWLGQFSANIKTYAEDNGEIHGAYGYRWRKWFGFDQLKRIVQVLKQDPTSRQAVLQMWDPTADLVGQWRDRPCNTEVFFDCRNGILNMTVVCRSNDILWGAYGANVVHFSVLQEVIAAGCGVPVGVYRQFSNNWHAYLENEQVQHFLTSPPLESYDAYGLCQPYPLVQPWETVEDFLADCEVFVQDNGALLRTDFMNKVAQPLRYAYLARKAGQPWRLETIADCDWKLAFKQWTERRMVNEQQGK